MLNNNLILYVYVCVYLICLGIHNEKVKCNKRLSRWKHGFPLDQESYAAMSLMSDHLVIISNVRNPTPMCQTKRTLIKRKEQWNCFNCFSLKLYLDLLVGSNSCSFGQGLGGKKPQKNRSLNSVFHGTKYWNYLRSR